MIPRIFFILLSVGVFQTAATAQNISATDCRNVSTAVDLDQLTEGDGEVIVGLAGGRGHSSTWNEPHTVRFCTLTDDGNDIEVSSECSTFQTRVDADIMTSCQANAVVVSFAGGRGHSSTWNESHRFKCCSLRGYKTERSETKDTKVDDNTMTECPSGFAVTGIEGGKGHSSTFNEPHAIECSRVFK